MSFSARLLPLLLVALVLPLAQSLFPGCALLDAPAPEEEVRFEHAPKPRVYLDGRPIGKEGDWRVDADLNRQQTYRVRIEMATRKPVDIAVKIPWEQNPEENSWVVGTLRVNLAVDLETGSVFRFDARGPRIGFRKHADGTPFDPSDVKDKLWVSSVIGSYVKNFYPYAVQVARLERR